MNRRDFHRVAIASPAIAFPGIESRAADTGWSFLTQPDRVEIRWNGRPVATYVTKHPKIRRPFFQDIFTPGGMRITRPVKPDPNVEDTDHDTMHPGLWLAFGDFNGVDYWRNKAEVRHVRFSKPVTVENDRLFFENENHYLDVSGNDVVCRESASYVFRSVGREIVLDWTSTFSTGSRELRFGHQEEMGLGLRLTRALTVKKGQGRIDCSSGGVNEKGTWGKRATWWAASVPGMPEPKIANTTRRGIQILAAFEPANRPFWGHTRDYGLIVANPSPMPGSGVQAVSVPSPEPAVLRFRVRLFDAADANFAGWASTWAIENP